MHFPWKKAKVTRISRLVADLHQSPKRGGSLVVETGFPTSLIDLFVKNRDRLRKPPKRKSSRQIPTPSTSLPSESPQPFPSPPRNEELPSSDIDDVGELVLITGECDERIAFHAAFKVFLVVALAVSTRNFAVWIMMAAFLLVLIEFVGTRFLGFSRPESNFAFFDSWIRRGLLVLKKRWDWEQGSTADDELVVKQQGTGSPDPRGSIELEDNLVGVGKSYESLQTQIKMEEIQIQTRREILTCKSERSGSARIKRTLIKKFVPKKLRCGKKQGKSKNKDESCSQLRVDAHKLDEEKPEPDADGEEVEDETETETKEQGSCKQVEEIGDMVSTSVQVLQAESEAGIVKDKVENVGKGNLGYLILFVIVVLAGLIGGRGAALLLTLVCCLILRFIGRQRR